MKKMINDKKMTENNILADKTIDFSIRIIRCYKYLTEEKNEYIISKQLFRSGTSIGANVHEAIQAQSKPDFINKLSISLKEASESSYWITLLQKTEFLDQKLYSQSGCLFLLKNFLYYYSMILFHLLFYKYLNFYKHLNMSYIP